MRRFFSSFLYALEGVIQLLRTERNFQVQFGAFITTLILGVSFQINSVEWFAILIVSALVMGLEAMNSALEKLCNLVSPEKRPEIKIIKDVAAGGVLIAAVMALIVGFMIFGSRFFSLTTA
jgi:diacylglycerol kinase